jgi:membrane protein implicated in regulation of membrane protease activity
MTIAQILSKVFTLRLSAVLTLFGLGFMVWSMLVPTPLPVMLAMTVGQGLGTAAFAIYAAIVIGEIRREIRRGQSRDQP